MLLQSNQHSILGYIVRLQTTDMLNLCNIVSVTLIFRSWLMRWCEMQFEFRQRDSYESRPKLSHHLLFLTQLEIRRINQALNCNKPRCYRDVNSLLFFRIFVSFFALQAYVRVCMTLIIETWSFTATSKWSTSIAQNPRSTAKILSLY